MTTKLKATITTAALMLGSTLAFTSHAQTPNSLNDIVQAERARMQASHPRSDKEVSPSIEKDDQWMLRTPGTWSYLINREKLRMKNSQPAPDSKAIVSQHEQKSMLTPTTMGERLRMEHKKMSNE